MEYKKHELEDIVTYYIHQVFKILYLFEGKDKEGYKHVYRVLREIDALPYLIKDIDITLIGRMNINLELLYDELLLLDHNNHQYVKNLMFECRNLLVLIREGL